jgi:hypothetical protein
MKLPKALSEHSAGKKMLLDNVCIMLIMLERNERTQYNSHIT